MGNDKISSPVVGIILAVVVLIVVVLGYRFLSPPQKLGPEAQAMWDAMHRAQAPQR
jgi:hypothetical protein